MLTFHAPKRIEVCGGVSRRDFLKVGGLGAVGLNLAELARAEHQGARPSHKAVIELFLVGGPSQLETWDLKPDAPEQVRGPFRPIATNVPGIEISEHFPLMAQMADRYSLVRSMHHNEAPIHETGHQLMQTGYLFRNGVERPHMGAVASKLLGRVHDAPAWIGMPGRLGNTGVDISHGQSCGFLGEEHNAAWLGAAGSHELARLTDVAHRASDALSPVDRAAETALDSIFSGPAKQAVALMQEPDLVRHRYGTNTFGQSCLIARRLVEAGVRLVTVNMFDSVFNSLSWDMHANGGSLSVTMDDYKNVLCPMFDQAYSALLDDLSAHGMLDDVLVVAMGEFGRTPKLNPRGGRDHWPGAWTVLTAGGGTQGGRIVGATDDNGAAPRDRPVAPAELVASIYHVLGIDSGLTLTDNLGRSIPVVEAAPIHELL